MAARTAILALGLIAAAGGCTATVKGPDLGGLYNREAQYHADHRNPVIVIPGILGSRLVDAPTGRVVWGAFAGDYADPGTADGARLAALPMREGAPLAELRDDVAPTGVLDRLHVTLLGLPLELKAYLNILAALGVGGYRDEALGSAGAVEYGEGHFTCFQFPYDWRRDNVENARRLHEFILEKRRYVQEELRRRFGVTDREVKFDIVAHSMGGLLAHYYLRYGPNDLPADGSAPPVTWEGARYVERAVFIGTPSAGSAEAVVQLVQGIRFASILPAYPAALLGTFPSIYQLFPRTRHGPVVDAADPARRVDIYAAEAWESHDWGLAARGADGDLEVLLPGVPDPEARRRIALDHLRKCLERARRFNEALDRQASPPAGLDLYLIAGDAVPTRAVLAADRGTGELTTLTTSPGDGTVLRTSALLDERVGGEWSPVLRSPIAWRHVMFLFSDHLGLTKDPAFTDNVLYLLLEDPRR